MHWCTECRAVRAGAPLVTLNIANLLPVLPASAQASQPQAGHCGQQRGKGSSGALACIWCCCSTVSLHHWTLETGEQVWFQVLVHSSALQGNHIQPRLSKLNKSIEQIHQVKDKVIFCYSLFRHKHQNSCFNSVVT